MFCAKNSGIARGQILLVARRKCMPKSGFHVQNKGFGKEKNTFFAVYLSKMYLGNVEMRKM